MFEFLFNYSRATFERAEFLFASGWPVWLLGALVVVGAVPITWSLVRGNQELGRGRTAVLAALQVAMWAVVLTLLWQPALLTQTLRAQENAVAVLLDTSASMNYGEGDESRLQEAVGALENETLPALGEEFTVDRFAFSGDTTRLESLDRVPAPGDTTRIGDALLDVLRGANAGALGAVVLVSDGSDTSNELDAARIAEIASFGVPVHTLGVGREVIEEDIELDDVALAPRAMPGSTVGAQVSVRHSGQEAAQLKVYDGDAIIASKRIELPSQPGVTTRWVDIEIDETGVRDLRFALDPLPGETNVVNNEQLRPMEVPEQRLSVLYIEGEPRWEYKFMRRALADLDAVRLAGLLRTTPNKYYRQGLESPDELEDGFPSDAETLFEYDALVIGSFDAASLEPAQHELVREFVSSRGGSLLMLGGRRGLADGGWGTTTLAEVLPVGLPEVDAPSFMRYPAKAHLTPEGERSMMLRLESDDEANRESWQELPELADFQYVDRLKPGAVTLLEAEIQGSREPLLVHQRFGRGNAWVLATGGTWRWQMQLPHEDMRHETFWRQLLQALASSAPKRVTLSSERSYYADESTVTLRSEVRNAEFEPARGAEVELSISSGGGEPRTVTMTPVTGEPGVYEATVEASEQGIHRFEATARAGESSGTGAAQETAAAGDAGAGADAEDGDGEASDIGLAPQIGDNVSSEAGNGEAAQADAASDAGPIGSARLAVRRADGVAEHFDIRQNRPLLERLADATGGRYFTLDEAGSIPEAVRFSEAGLVERRVLDLWHMPFNFLLLLLLKGGEWLLRLRWGRL